MKTLTLALLLLGSLSATDRWDPLRFLIGDWAGAGTGQPGEGTGSFSFRLDLDRKILVRKNRASYPATPQRPAFSHEDLMVVYPEPAGDKLRAIYFDNEGHVIHYAVASSADSVEFLSDPAPAGPRFRLSYRRTGPGKLALKFEIAPPGKPEAFSSYIEATASKRAE
ncbi:MAG: hypothetical protein HYR60_30600 [Acidobacteria bacterium]|nr:hypothetical protein [Acidobacteriota bacterium]